MLPANRVRHNYCINILHNYKFNLLCTVLFQQSDINIIMMVSYCLYLLKISEKTVCSQSVFVFKILVRIYMYLRMRGYGA
jgi:ABC-type protease/lipase transport system fused ATPase/permease subunit